MEGDNGQGRDLRTPLGSPTLPLGRRPRSPARHRACSRERRSRSRSSRRSMGRPSRCSPNQMDQRSRYTPNQNTRVSRSISRRSSNHCASPERLAHDRAVCVYNQDEYEVPNRVSCSRSRSRLRGQRRSCSRDRHRDGQDRDRRRDCRDRSRRRVNLRLENERHYSSSSSIVGASATTSLLNQSLPGNPTTLNDSGFRKPNSELTHLLETLLAANNNQFNKLGSINNTIPEFDPSRREQTMAMWLHKVNECATIYGWSERHIIHFALPKLKGFAQRWYESLPSVLYTWAEWQQKLLSAFPSEENYGQMLSDMLAKRARFADSLEDYFYDKVALLNRCGITGKRAVECIIHGIDDRSVKLGAEAAQYTDPDKLLTFLRNAKGGRPNSDRKFVKGPTNRNSDNSRSLNRPLRCTNCKKDDHTTSQCKLPIKKCGRCNRIGHETEQCYAKLPVPGKTVMKIASDFSSLPELPIGISEVNAKYYKNAIIDGNCIPAFIDFGSECTMIKLSEFNKLGYTFEDYNLPTLRGFGNSAVKAIGKKTVRMIVDGVEANVELLIVPDSVMHVPLFIGQSFTEQPHVVIRKTSEYLEITQLTCQAEIHSKVKVFTQNEVILSEFSVIDVFTEPKIEGEIYIEGGIRYHNGSQYCVATGLFHIAKGVGKLVITKRGNNIIGLPKNFLIARGRIANEDAGEFVNVMSCSSGKLMKPISEEDIKSGDVLSCEEKDKLLELLNRYRHCFAYNLTELGSTSVGEMTINLLDNDPVVYRPYRLAIAEKDKVRSMISELLDNDIIRPSKSPYASPIVLVRKKTNDFRLCIDYRALNKKKPLRRTTLCH